MWASALHAARPRPPLAWCRVAEGSVAGCPPRRRAVPNGHLAFAGDTGGRQAVLGE